MPDDQIANTSCATKRKQLADRQKPWGCVMHERIQRLENVRCIRYDAECVVPSRTSGVETPCEMTDGLKGAKSAKSVTLKDRSFVVAVTFLWDEPRLASGRQVYPQKAWSPAGCSLRYP